MRSLPMLAAATLLLVAAATPAAGRMHAQVHSEDFSWAADGAALRLHSSGASGVVVTGAEPGAFHGLRRGDHILAVDGRLLRQVGDLTHALRDGRGTLQLRVERGGVQTTLAWLPADYRVFAPPAPPAPPPAPRPAAAHN